MSSANLTAFINRRRLEPPWSRALCKTVVKPRWAKIRALETMRSRLRLHPCARTTRPLEGLCGSIRRNFSVISRFFLEHELLLSSYFFKLKAPVILGVRCRVSGVRSLPRAAAVTARAGVSGQITENSLHFVFCHLFSVLCPLSFPGT